MSEAEENMWEEYRLNGASFTAGDAVEKPEMREDRLRKEAEIFGLWNPEGTARKLGFGDQSIVEEEDDDWLAQIIGNIGESRSLDMGERDKEWRWSDLDGPEPQEIQNSAPQVAADKEWFPYPSKMMFLLDTLDNLLRLRISSSLMRVFLWILKEANCKNVPSFDQLRKVQKQLRAQCGIPTIPCKSPLGNIFYINDPKAIIAKDWANPTTRKLIHVYPEIPEDGIIREVWHAEKWRKAMDLDILSPMYDAGLKHYYVNEVARLRDGRLIIPVRWVKFRGHFSADELTQNFHNLEEDREIPEWGASTKNAGHHSRMPNPKRKIAAGRPLYSSFVNYFADDVSGNRSKSWNKHWNAYLTHQNLPRRILQQEFHVHFVSTSPHASVAEQFREFKAALDIYCNAGPSDNPMQSEICSHIGGKGNCFCRKCRVGGSQKDKATDDGYHALFEAGMPRTKEYILSELEKQVEMACSGISKPVKELQTETGVKDAYTQVWIDDLIARFKQMRKDNPARSVEEIQKELIQWTVENRDTIYNGFLTTKGFDPTKDTPIEILHTILLGIIKYVWHITHTPWSVEQKQKYALRLQSTTVDGLSIHPIRSAYILQYAGSLIGRQLKTLAQTNIFHLYGLVRDDLFTAWKAAGELSALLWVPEIRNLAEYRADLKTAIANVLDIFAKIDPSKIVTKIKYHLLTHADEDVARFGPLIGVATEIFESFNGVFRYCSILSNHLAPSRDIALQLADQEGMKHRLTGGWWPMGEGGTWERPGSGVRQFMTERPVLQKLLGWSAPESAKPGEFKLVSVKRGEGARKTFALRSTSASRALNFGNYAPESLWRKCSSVVAESLDECFLSSWVFATSPMNSSVISGRISDILVDDSDAAVLVVEMFQILGARDDIFGMPVLVRRDAETTFLIIPAKNIKFKFNTQHDCHSANCEASGQRLRMQERTESDQVENYIVHQPLDRFFINMHAVHNSHLLRATLPRDLVAPIPLFPDSDRRAKHFELASVLRAQKAAKKASSANKRKKPEATDNESDVEEMQPRPSKKRKTGTKKKSTSSAAILAGPSVAAKEAQDAESGSEEDLENAMSHESDKSDKEYSNNSDSD
ncbi:hypothetical protein R3P38DRAFT_3588421 [Favolaschia claudopus]|uniref:Uncharacterized protein n=1 Tax=Favolaschia claudopus TaxID=2862362 RepID=A0AAW0AJK3_9AGAR